MIQKLNRWKRCQQFCAQNQQSILMGVLSGLLTGTSYIPFFPWAILFNFAPLWWYWFYQASNRKQILLSGFIAQFIFNLIGFHWVFHTAHEFGHIPIPLSFIVLLLFAALAHLYVPFVGLIFFEIKSKFSAPSHSLSKSPTTLSSAGLLVTLCGLWCLAEIYWPYLFQWHMGYTLLWAKFPLFHWADAIGFQGLALILLLFNGFMVFWMRHNLTLIHFIKGLSICFSLFAVLNLGGWLHGNDWIKNYKPTQTINFLPVQANIGNQEKIMAERGLGTQDFIVDRFIQLSTEAVAQHPEAQILVWPESAIPDYLDPDYSHRRRPQKIKNFLTQVRKGLITGAYSKELIYNPTSKNDNVKEKTYNALFAFNDEGNLTSLPYRKHQLLAFGEYTPFAQWIPYLNEISPAGEGFNIGPGPGVRDHDLFKFVPQLCYEALYPADTRQSVLLGAQILINLTNDSWFGASFEPHQHLSMTFARAIENRRPLLRVTNTGITSAIDASGNIAVQSPLFQEWAEVIPVSFEKTPSLTLFTRYGGFFPLFVLLMTLGGLTIMFWNQKAK